MTTETKIKVQWLQCTIPLSEWEKINARRQKLGLTWGELIYPAVVRQLNDLEAGKIKQPAKKETTPTTAKKGATSAAGDKPATTGATTKGRAPAKDAPATATKGKGAAKKADSGNDTLPPTDPDLQELANIVKQEEA